MPLSASSPASPLVTRSTPGELHRLVEQIRAVETNGGLDPDGGKRRARVATGWPAIDAELGGGLLRGALHEWYGTAPPGTIREEPDSVPSAHSGPRVARVALRSEDGGAGGEHRRPGRAAPSTAASRAAERAWWTPPLCLLQHLAHRASTRTAPFIGWVGRSVWPHPLVFIDGERSHDASEPSRDAALDGEPDGARPRHSRWSRCPDPSDWRAWARSIFIDPPDDASRLWAIDMLVRSGVFGVIVADGSRLSLTATRRLQIAAETTATLVLLARPASERVTTLSAATTRWSIERRPSATLRPAWQLTLCRNKSAGLSAGRRPGRNDDASASASTSKRTSTNRTRAGGEFAPAFGPVADAVRYGALDRDQQQHYQHGPRDPSREHNRGSPAFPERRARGAIRNAVSEDAGSAPKRFDAQRRRNPNVGAWTRSWPLEWDHAQGVVAVSADMVDRPSPAPSNAEGTIGSGRTVEGIPERIRHTA